MAEETLYDRLGVPRDATPEEIRRAYREKARRLHPDYNVKPGETQLFIDIQQAYDILSNPESKQHYDKDLPTQPHPEQLLVTRVQYSRTALTPMNEPQLIYVLLEILPRPDADIPKPPLNICLVLDCSTSMQGARLDAVKATAIEIVRQMGPQDIISVVRFSDRAESLVPSALHTDRAAVEMRIQVMQASGGTEIYQGLEAGLDEVRRYRSDKHINHLILITDGRTYGDEEACLHLANLARQQNIGISALGIGSQWNDRFLDQLAARTGGNSKYIAKIEDIHQFMQEKVIRLGRSYADHITYEFHAEPGVEISYAFRLNPETALLDLTNPLVFGSVPRDASQNLLLEFTVRGIAPEAKQLSLTNGYITYQIPSHKTQTSHRQRLELSRRVSADPESEPPSISLVQAMARLTLYRMQERARQDIENGHVKEAARRLQNLATHLLAQGQRDLARSVLSEVAHIQQHQTFSEEGDKKIKYGTRSLMLPPGTKEKNP